MLPFETLLIGIWTLAGASLLAMVYLFWTWPKQSPKASPARSPGIATSATAVPDWARSDAPLTAPLEATLDGLLPPSSAPAPTARGGRAPRKSQAPVTLNQRLLRAGLYRKGSVRTFFLVRTVLTLAISGLAAVSAPLAGLPADFAFYLAATFGLAAYLAPSFWLDARLRARQVQLRRALPDALDLITVCIQGGLSLPASFARVAGELGPAHPLLAEELAIVEREIQMGRTTGSAMLQFAQRFHLEELRSLAAVVSQTEKYGGSISSALKTYAEGLRTKRRQRAEELAQKAAVKLLFPTLLCIFPGIFVVVLGPTAMRMVQVMGEVSWGG